MNQQNLNPRDDEMQENLERLADSIQPTPAFVAELERKLKNAHQPKRGFSLPSLREMFPALGLALALVALGFGLNYILRNLAPVQPQPAVDETPTLVPSPEPFIVEETANPDDAEYKFYDQPVTLEVPFPDAPAQMNIFLTGDEARATLESVRALATQFGMAGEIYQTPDLTGKGQTDFLVVDGNQRLEVISDRYFNYYPDFTRWRMPVITAALDEPTPEVNATIANFLQSKGFNVSYKVTTSQLLGAYIVQPLTPDGFPIVHEYFASNGITIRMDGSNILSAEFSLLSYNPVATGSILSAEEAFQKFLDPTNDGGGYLMGMNGSSAVQPEIWYRAYPKNETVTIWGYVNSFPSLDGGAPLVTFDGYTATGDFSNLPAETWMKFIQATGQIKTENGADIFAVESWNFFDGFEDGFFGTLQRVGADVQLVTEDGSVFTVPDVPADLSLPKENMYLVGVKQDNVFEWKSMEYWSNGLGGGGGGGGGGIGFYKLNLTGSPVPFPTASAPPLASADGIPYIVVAGDTCASIAAAFIVDVNDIISINNLPADCSTLAIGQTIYLPFAAAMPPQDVNLRGILSITIFEKEDGSRRFNYGFLNMGAANEIDAFYYYILEGDGLEALQQYNGRPMDVWGKLEALNGVPTINVERFEIPFPDLQFQIMKGVESTIEIEGQAATLLTDESGAQFVELGTNCHDIVDPATSLGIMTGEAVVMEVLAVPDLTVGGYPAICVFSMAQAINPKNGEPMQLEVAADQPSILPEQPNVDDGTLPTLTVESIELVYYVPNPRYLTPDPNGEPFYIQPVWLFIGHYSNGDAFFVMVQALTRDYLLPELAPFTAPG